MKYRAKNIYRQTGYPSVDKPWLRFYTKEAPDLPSPDTGIYDFLYENSRDRLDMTALDYFGTKITYRELFRHVDKVASALRAYGVRKGDIVTLCPLNTPEFIYLLYAVNKVGAASNMIGLTSPKTDLRDQLIQTHSRFVFVIS